MADKEIGVAETIVSAAELIRSVVFDALKLTPFATECILETVSTAEAPEGTAIAEPIEEHITSPSQEGVDAADFGTASPQEEPAAA